MGTLKEGDELEFEGFSFEAFDSNLGFIMWLEGTLDEAWFMKLLYSILRRLMKEWIPRDWTLFGSRQFYAPTK